MINLHNHFNMLLTPTEIPGFQGVYANSQTLEICRDELQEVLEGWIVLGLQLGHTLPAINGITLLLE